jgi:hypothetical protein
MARTLFALFFLRGLSAGKMPLETESTFGFV